VLLLFVISGLHCRFYNVQTGHMMNNYEEVIGIFTNTMSRIANKQRMISVYILSIQRPIQRKGEENEPEVVFETCEPMKRVGRSKTRKENNNGAL
jgi:hypothetical protein